MVNCNDEKWGHKNKIKGLLDSRKYLYRNDYIPYISNWLGIFNGAKILDFGCGLGFLGNVFEPYFSTSGKYTGIDISEKVIISASRLAKQQGYSNFTFKKGDINTFNFKEIKADFYLTQALLIHLSNPQKIIKDIFESIPLNSTVFIAEPDHSSSLMYADSSLPKMPIELGEFKFKLDQTLISGRNNALRGDYYIGSKVANLLRRANFEDIDVIVNNKVINIFPPYESEEDIFWINKLKSSYETILTNDLDLEKFELYLQDGGKYEDFEFYKNLHIWEQKSAKIALNQIENNAFYLNKTSTLYLTKATKK